MALQVAPVHNLNFTGLGNAPKMNITRVGVATPGSNGFASLYPSIGKVPDISANISQGNSMLAQNAALLAAISRLQNSQPRQVYAPAINFAAINAQARQAAENAVNPYYTKQLNDFLSQQAAKQKQQEAATKTTISNLQEDLSNKLQANTITGQRTAEDTAQNVAELQTAQDQFQTDTGQQFAGDRLQQARELAAAGLTGGLGAQQAEASQLSRNTTEARQTASNQQQQEVQQLTKARTFEDLARSGTLSTAAEKRGETQANVDLTNFITNLGFETHNKKSDLELARLQAVSAEQSNQGKLAVNNFINTIADPAQRNAAYQAYGGLF